jgi:hypothetical protein
MMKRHGWHTELASCKFGPTAQPFVLNNRRNQRKAWHHNQLLTQESNQGPLKYEMNIRVCDPVRLQHLPYMKSVHICLLAPTAPWTQSYTLTPNKIKPLYWSKHGWFTFHFHALPSLHITQRNKWNSVCNIHLIRNALLNKQVYIV